MKSYSDYIGTSNYRQIVLVPLQLLLLPVSTPIPWTLENELEPRFYAYFHAIYSCCWGTYFQGVRAACHWAMCGVFPYLSLLCNLTLFVSQQSQMDMNPFPKICSSPNASFQPSSWTSMRCMDERSARSVYTCHQVTSFLQVSPSC